MGWEQCLDQACAVQFLCVAERFQLEFRELDAMMLRDTQELQDWQPSDAERLRDAFVLAANRHMLWWDTLRSKAMLMQDGAPIVVPRVRLSGGMPKLRPSLEVALTGFKDALFDAAHPSFVTWMLKGHKAFFPMQYRIKRANPVELAYLARMVPALHDAVPTSELTEMIAAWLHERCMVGEGLYCLHRAAVADWEQFTDGGFNRAAWGRALALHGIRFARGLRGRRLLVGFALNSSA